jgi:hypothetical protein
VALDLLGECMPFSKEARGDPTTLVIFYALKGQVDVGIRYKRFKMKGPAIFTWNSVSDLAEPEELKLGPPDWWTNPNIPETPLAKSMKRALDALPLRLLDNTDNRKSRPLDVVLAENLKNADETGRALALRCLGALGDFSSLLSMLANEKVYPGVRLIAAGELRHLLGIDAKYDQQLLQALKQKNYSALEAQNLVFLLHGVSKEQWVDPELRLKLVEYLLDSKLAIRQLTHPLLISKVPEGASIPYDPAGDADQWERAYEAWKRLVAK